MNLCLFIFIPIGKLELFLKSLESSKGFYHILSIKREIIFKSKV